MQQKAICALLCKDRNPYSSNIMLDKLTKHCSMVRIQGLLSNLTVLLLLIIEHLSYGFKNRFYSPKDFAFDK